MDKIATKTLFLPGAREVVLYAVEIGTDTRYNWLTSSNLDEVEQSILTRGWPRDSLEDIKAFTDWFNPKYEAQMNQLRLFEG